VIFTVPRAFPTQIDTIFVTTAKLYCFHRKPAGPKIQLLGNNQVLRMAKNPVVQRKRFAYDTVNTLWQGDMSIGPYLTVGSKKCRTFLFAFLDDCSRLIPHAPLFLPFPGQ
jgi:hypothetical protein